MLDSCCRSMNDSVQGVHVHKLAISPERTQLVTDVSLDTRICPCIYSLLDVTLCQRTDSHVLRQRESYSLKSMRVQDSRELGTSAQLFGT